MIKLVTRDDDDDGGDDGDDDDETITAPIPLSVAHTRGLRHSGVAHQRIKVRLMQERPIKEQPIKGAVRQRSGPKKKEEKNTAAS